MLPQHGNVVKVSEGNTLREMFPWLTALLVFLCLTSFYGESKEAKGALVQAVGAAAAVPFRSVAIHK